MLSSILMNRIYFDNSSTSFPKPKSVIMAMNSYFYENGSNLQRGESSYNFAAEDVIFSLREELSNLVSSNNSECVIFTPNVTTALNTVIRGYLNQDDHVIISTLEHNAVMRPLVENNISYSLLESDNLGHVLADKIKKSLKKETKACIIQGANNVTGCVQNINEIGNVLKEYGIPLILDSAQSLGHIDYNLEKDNISILCFTGHKSLFGPQGTGGFITNREIIKEIKPLIYGGTGSFSDLLTQPENLPDKFESGTQNIIGLMGLSAAVKYLSENKVSIREKERELRSYFVSLIEEIKCIKIHSYSDEIPIVSISSNSFDVAKLANFLSSNNIQTRVGLHCNVMTHKFINTYPSGTIRFSFSHFNTKAELDICFCYIKEFLNDEGLL